MDGWMDWAEEHNDKAPILHGLDNTGNNVDESMEEDNGDEPVEVDKEDKRFF